MLPWPARASAVTLGALIGCAAASYRPQGPEPPTVALRLWPRHAFLAPHSAGIQVRATLLVYNPTPEQRCARELWEWGDLERSGHEEWCVPSELEPWYPGVPMVMSKTHVYRYAGEFEVRVTLLDAEGLRAVASETLVLKGGDDE